jgi:hypothetical protein
MKLNLNANFASPCYHLLSPHVIVFLISLVVTVQESFVLQYDCIEKRPVIQSTTVSAR